MAKMGRRRKADTGMEPRVYFKHGAYYYAHRGGKWERLGTDLEQANAKARLFNDPSGNFGTMVYWLDMFILDCERRVALKSDIKNIKLSQRTYEDYRDSVGTEENPGPLRVFFKPPVTPLDVIGQDVQDFLHDNAEAGRPKRANLDRACLSACFGWLLRNRKVPGLVLNPCLRSAGVQRNPEKKRERYVTHEEYQEVFEVATRSERLLMELTYRTLQRPESDIILWDTSIITKLGDQRVLKFRQHKTGTQMTIAMGPALEALLPKPAGNVRRLKEPIVRRLDGGFYTYDGLSSMLKRSIAVANERRKARKIDPIPPFGYRDLKGKGATDMYYIDEVPIQQIQQLLGHANQTTTEIYIKARWRMTVEANKVVVG